MPPLTQKQQIEQIANSQANLSLSFSAFINNQEKINKEKNDSFQKLHDEISKFIIQQASINQEVLSYIKTDVTTGRMGMPTTLAEHEKRISTLEKFKEITAGKILTAVFIFTSLSAIFWKVLDYIELKFK